MRYLLRLACDVTSTNRTANPGVYLARPKPVDGRFKLGVTLPLAAFAMLSRPQAAWALYGQATAVTIVDWVIALTLSAFAIYLLVWVKFGSRTKTRMGWGLVLLNALVWAVAHIYILYIDWKVSGWNALQYLELPSSVLHYFWLASVPATLLAVALLSKKAVKMTGSVMCIMTAGSIAEIALNYHEINGYLTHVEKSGYSDFEHDTQIRNYLSASGMKYLRFFPRRRTSKVLLAELKSDSWATRHEAALGLEYLNDPTTAPYLVECLDIKDSDDSSDQARRQCAVTLQMLLLDDHTPSLHDQIKAEHEADPAALYQRLKQEAARLPQPP